MNMRARGARGVAQDRNKVQGVRPADGHNGCHIKRAHLRGPRHVPSAATRQYGVWRRRASDAHHSASGRNLRNLQAQSASCARRGGYRSLARPVFRRRWPGRVGDIWAQFRNRVSSRLPTSSVKPSKAAKTYQYVATFCRPLMFSRPDGTHGFEEFRRDAEDRGAWTPVLRKGVFLTGGIRWSPTCTISTRSRSGRGTERRSIACSMPATVSAGPARCLSTPSSIGRGSD